MRYYVTFLCLAVMSAVPIPAGAVIDPLNPSLTDWGTWSTVAGNPTFTADLSVAQFASQWASEDDKTASDKSTTPGYRAGGEWFDIEGLYMRLKAGPSINTVSGLDFALVTSFNGMDPEHPGSLLTIDTKYRHSPVIALDLNGAAGYDWALVLDAGDAQESQYGGGATIAATPSFYQVNPGGWLDAAPLPNGFGGIADWGTNPPKPNPVDFIDSSGTLQQTSSAVSRRYQSYDETGYQMTDSLWRQPSNWTWKGSLTFTTPIYASYSHLTNPADPTSSWWDPAVHISMPCGNDWLNTSYHVLAPIDGGGGQFGVPEPSLGLLLLAGIVPLGLAWRRRRR